MGFVLRQTNSGLCLRLMLLVPFPDLPFLRVVSDEVILRGETNSRPIIFRIMYTISNVSIDVERQAERRCLLRKSGDSSSHDTWAMATRWGLQCRRTRPVT
eukprot:gb/GEZJ01006531.1/.p1 GENE.gb/GEZJ01006531.1/~~gb/GEZJ01006531.1/.p1  ORF type:complete len:101 (-),score=1.91 gb/GEZJ01006531.1/:486-788(-)